MTPELQAFYDALELLLMDEFMTQLVDVFSMALGVATGLAFVATAVTRWDT